jgi:hypothetical protein
MLLSLPMDTNNSLLNLSPADLRRAAQIKEQIDSLNAELGSILSGTSGRTSGNSAAAAPTDGRRGGRRTMSPAARAKIAAAAKARWAKFRAAKGGSAPAPAAKKSGRRQMSPAARAKIAAAAKARWAKAKAANKNHL